MNEEEPICMLAGICIESCVICEDGIDPASESCAPAAAARRNKSKRDLCTLFLLRLQHQMREAEQSYRGWEATKNEKATSQWPFPIGIEFALRRRC